MNIINIYIKDICNRVKIIIPVRMGDLIAERILIGNTFLVYIIGVFIFGDG